MTRLRSFGALAMHVRLRRCLLVVAALGLLARPVAAQTEVVEYYGHDALGSIRIVFSASGTATARADFEPFGEAVTIAGMPAGPLPAQQFTGQERDALESQDYFGARYYRPRHGRFSQVDPVYAGLFDPQQWNRYAYARNNPLTFVDPDGLAARESTDTSCAAMTAINKGDTPCYWMGAATPGLSPQAQAFLNGADNSNQFAGQASQELRTGPTKQAGGRDGSDRKNLIPLVNETTGETTYVTVEELLTETAKALVLAIGMAVAPIAAQAIVPTATVAASRSTGMTVLGRSPGYIQRARELGANYFHVSDDVWSAMSPTQQWAANQRFLDQVIARGDDIYLATKPWNAPPGSPYSREINYLVSQGYRWSSDGTRMVRLRR